MSATATIARQQTARKYARIIDALTRAAKKPNDSHSLRQASIENIQIELLPDTVRLTAANGFVLAIVDLPVADNPRPAETPATALFTARDTLAVARALKKNSVHDARLTLTFDDEFATLESAHNCVEARSVPNPHFPDCADIIPAVMEDADCERTAVNPELLAVATKICAEIQGVMRLTAVSNSGPLRIDCSGDDRAVSRWNERAPRAVVAVMPMYVRWDNPAAMDLRTNPNPDPGSDAAKTTAA